MLRMLRFRRFRIFLGFAAVAIVLLLRYGHSDWDEYLESGSGTGQSSLREDSLSDVKHPLDALNGYPKDADKQGDLYLQKTTDAANLPAIESAKQSKEQIATKTPLPQLSSTSSGIAVVQTVPHIVLPDRTRPVDKGTEQDELVDDIHPIGPPGRQEHPVFSAVPITIHWEKQIEHFPVPTESLIHLPTGAPVKIPTIQFDFNDETTDAKINREKRQSKVREEFQRAWNGYKTNAWLHDELSPVSGKFRDPFCGWAATLVDSLDTLWIMGLQEEFEEAARAVDLIDFTTSPRSDIPVFETTIRYLGGLLSAYDVSGGIYKNLLDKAVELGDILLGAFDTPNRMPVLFYRWKPSFASQPHRASTRANLAELGSLSMEFTRLAQLTKDPRYYDAVARVTNALSEWQDRGTMLPGVFPDNADASGCNRSISLTPHEPKGDSTSVPLSPAKNADPPHGYEPSNPKTVAEPKPRKGLGRSGQNDLEVQIVPGEPSKAHIVGWDDQHAIGGKNKKRELPEHEDSNETTAEVPITKDLRDEVVSDLTNGTSTAVHPVSGRPLDGSSPQNELGSTLGDWDCVPQGLTSATRGGRNKFSMGGGQDSTYEYFPKQYLLLAGREEQYRKMYLKTIDAIRDWMLYRPMLPDNRDVLFSASVTTMGQPETDLKLTAEVEHLTCFIGGMVGMGAKIFGLEGDLEIAKKLADGCVWAYESTPSGIMPEGATVYPCVSAESCTWNETAYWLALDPQGSHRDVNLAVYIENKATRDAELVELREAELRRVEQDRTNAESQTLMTPDEDIDRHEANAANIQPEKQAEDIAEHHEKTKSAVLPISTLGPVPTSQPGLQKRQQFARDVSLGKETAGERGPSESVASPPTIVMPQEKQFMEKSLTTEAELGGFPEGRQAEAPMLESSPTTVKEEFPDPLRPLSHEEYVRARIKQESLPPGYVSLQGRRYILRPEAIESVWYMYRITGDTSWQDKGWKMFEAIIKSTSTQYGHSAIYDVTSRNSSQIDEMESFWLAETLKYFYLLYSTPDTISLDDWVLNTEAHPFKRER